uniref:Uncharacterized protein n=1 Tax=Anopheles culicifacies TaxID=139723 RepID=A0A182M7U1_9DIPT
MTTTILEYVSYAKVIPFVGINVLCWVGSYVCLSPASTPSRWMLGLLAGLLAGWLTVNNKIAVKYYNNLATCEFKVPELTPELTNYLFGHGCERTKCCYASIDISMEYGYVINPIQGQTTERGGVGPTRCEARMDDTDSSIRHEYLLLHTRVRHLVSSGALKACSLMVLLPVCHTTYTNFAYDVFVQFHHAMTIGQHYRRTVFVNQLKKWADGCGMTARRQFRINL